MSKIIYLTLFSLLGFCAPLSAAPTVPEAVAREYLKNGAVVVDVRTVAEYRAGHLTNVINIPLGELKTKLPEQITNRAQVILLHCRSGRRSGQAEAELQQLGYTNAFNLGSFEQARAALKP